MLKLNLDSERAKQILKVMRRRKWWSDLEVRDAYFNKHGVWFKDATMSRYLRAMRQSNLLLDADRHRRMSNGKSKLIKCFTIQDSAYRLLFLAA